MTAPALLGLAAVGGVLRFVVSNAANRRSVPWGTLLVNLTGSFALGLLADSSPAAVTMLGVGGLGSFTTFSTFSHEWVSMSRSGAAAEAVAYVTVTVIGSVAAAWAGLAVTA